MMHSYQVEAKRLSAAAYMDLFCTYPFSCSFLCPFLWCSYQTGNWGRNLNPKESNPMIELFTHGPTMPLFILGACYRADDISLLLFYLPGRPHYSYVCFTCQRVLEGSGEPAALHRLQSRLFQAVL